MTVGTVRVSAREVEETTRWAFIASGCSAGEAAVAARVVRRAEVHLRCGVDAANIELDRHRFSAEPIRRRPGPVETIDDEHGRGLLTLGSLATALAVTKGTAGTAVVIRNVNWHPVMAAVLIEGLRSSGSTGDGVAAWPLPTNVTDGAAALEPPGCKLVGRLGMEIATSTQPDRTDLDTSLAEPERSGSGIVIAAIAATAGPTSPPPPTMPGQAVPPRGVEVDATSWNQLYRRAESFLVSDS